MPPKCSICIHSDLEEINKDILAGVSLRNIAERFSVSPTSLHRHKKHIPEQLTIAQDAKEASQADRLLAEVKDLQNRATGILNKAEMAGDLPTALKAIKEAKGCLELLAKLQGELQQEGTVNIHVNTEWVELRTIIMQALEPYPEARGCLVKVLGDSHA